MSTEGSTKAVVAALVANMGIAVAKFVAFLFTGSGSMLAEAAHSVADSGNQGLLLLGGRRAKRKADAGHPFGYAREAYFAAFVVAVVLFTAGAGFAFREGLHKLSHPEPIDSPAIAIGVLLVAVVLEIFSFRTAIHAARPMLAGRSWWAFLRQNKTADLTVVLLEDLAALVGLILALIGVIVAAASHTPVWDAYGTLSIAALLGIIAILLAIETKSLLIGESATGETETLIRGVLDRVDQFQGIAHFRTEHRGPREILVAAKVIVHPDLDSGDLAAAIDRAEQDIRQVVPDARYIFIEPDVSHSGTGPDSESP